MLTTISNGAIVAAQAVGHWIYDFQTLITGAAAIGAAWYAGAPVWRQLKDSNLQTRIMHRETLSMRLREAEERAARVAKAIDEPLWQAQRVTSDPAGDPVEIGEHDAHGVEQLNSRSPRLVSRHARRHGGRAGGGGEGRSQGRTQGPNRHP